MENQDSSLQGKSCTPSLRVHERNIDVILISLRNTREYQRVQT